MPGILKSKTAPPATDPLQLVWWVGSTGNVEAWSTSDNSMPGLATSTPEDGGSDSLSALAVRLFSPVWSNNPPLIAAGSATTRPAARRPQIAYMIQFSALSAAA